MNRANWIKWWRLEGNSELRAYYLGFAIIWPLALILLFAGFWYLFRVPIPKLMVPWLALSVSIVLCGAPLLHWAHKNSLRTGSPRPVVFATEFMFFWCLVPFGYFLVREEGFDLWAAIGTALILLVPFVGIFWYPPKLLRDRIETARRRNAQPNSERISNKDSC
jgi:hypothetical protein